MLPVKQQVDLYPAANDIVDLVFKSRLAGCCAVRA